MAYKVKLGKEKTYIHSVILGEATQEQLKNMYESGDTRFIDKVETKKKPKKEKPKENNKNNES